jgi:hypothetical protein
MSLRILYTREDCNPFAAITRIAALAGADRIQDDRPLP